MPGPGRPIALIECNGHKLVSYADVVRHAVPNHWQNPAVTWILGRSENWSIGLPREICFWSSKLKLRRAIGINRSGEASRMEAHLNWRRTGFGDKSNEWIGNSEIRLTIFDSMSCP